MDIITRGLSTEDLYLKAMMFVKVAILLQTMPFFALKYGIHIHIHVQVRRQRAL